jgi:nicotinate-nucleotide--dimethylbenzimidazole phosphoribosyltransferase
VTGVTGATERDPARTLAETLERIVPLDAVAMAAARARLDRLTKPPGSLGRLEELAISLAGITGRPDAGITHRHVVVVAADHGVAVRGVSAYPPEVTAQMVANFVAGGAAVNVLAAAAGAQVTVVDIGVASTIPDGAGRTPGAGHLVRARIRDGTDDMSVGPAMARADAMRAIAVGIGLVDELCEQGGLDVLAIGEMGIGNTTAASALTATLTGEPVRRVTGRGTGVDDEGFARKIEVIERALSVNRLDPADPIAVLAAVGGLEIAALVGLVLGAAARGIPVILDGFITGAAALVAARLRPALPPRLIAAHRSPEPGHRVVLDALGLQPLLELEMCLGEGSGAALVMGMLVAACRVRDEMATFESAAISGPSRPTGG